MKKLRLTQYTLPRSLHNIVSPKELGETKFSNNKLKKNNNKGKKKDEGVAADKSVRECANFMGLLYAAVTSKFVARHRTTLNARIR